MSTGFVGRLTVVAHRATGLPDKQLIGKQDPYVRLECGKEKFQTKVHDAGGVNPSWDQAFLFNLHGKEDLFHIHVYDQEVLADRSIGRADLKIADACTSTGQRWVDLNDKDNFMKSAGKILVTFEFQGQAPPGVTLPSSTSTTKNHTVGAPSAAPAPPRSPQPSPSPSPSPSFPAVSPQPSPQAYPTVTPSQYPGPPPPSSNVYGYPGQYSSAPQHSPLPPPQYVPPPQQYPAQNPNYPAQYPHAQQQQPQYYQAQQPQYQQQYQQHPHPHPYPAPVTDWACSSCTFWNKAHLARCEMCGRPR